MEPNERGRINVHYIITYSSIDTTGFTGFQWGLAGTGVRLSLNGNFNDESGETLTLLR